MTFKPAIWKPIAFVVSTLNLVAVGVAAGTAEPYHAAGHAALALAFGLWSQRLGQRRDRSGGEVEVQDRFEGIEGELGDLRRELSEMQERMDFTERVLAQ